MDINNGYLANILLIESKNRGLKDENEEELKDKIWLCLRNQLQKNNLKMVMISGL